MSAQPTAAISPRRPLVTDWWYLVYLAMLGFQPVFDPDSGMLDWAIVAVTVALTVPLYVIGTRTAGAVRRRCTIALVGLAVVVVWFNGGASVLFVYAAGFAGTFEPREHAIRWLVGLTALLGVAAAMSPIPLLYRIAAFAMPLLLIWLVGTTTMAEAERDRESARLRVDNARIEHLATVTERARIARDLHDVLGQSLTGIVMRAQLAQRLVPLDPDRAVAEAAALERTARQALTEVREAVGGWRHVPLERELAVSGEALAAADIELSVDWSPDLVLEPRVEQALSLALREAVTNVVRHAGARRCTVSLVRDGGEVRLRVADDGSGGLAPEGNGLLGMRERLAAIGGRLQREAAGGTAVTISVPAEAVP